MYSKTQLRFLAIATLAALTFALTVALPGVSADGDGDEIGDSDHGQEQPPPITEKAEPKYPKLGSHLDRLAAGVGDGETSDGGASGKAAVHREEREESVAVTVHLSGNVEDVVSFLEENGGDPRNVGEDYVEAYVPLSLLGAVSEQPGVIRVREIVPPQPVQISQVIAGNGPAVHGSLAWNRAGYSGSGVKVGIIDSFRGLSDLMGTELPATVLGRCYTDIGAVTDNLADCGLVGRVSVGIPDCLEYAQNVALSNAEHGTVVAESLIDIAPDASLYIANPQSRGDLRDAVEWMASQGVQVINYSIGWTFDGPGDGTSPSSVSPLRTVDRAVANDIIWVNSAGNSGAKTWLGGYTDLDGDRYLEFGDRNDEAIGLSVRACRTYRVQLRWEDSWHGASTDLDIYLYNTRTRQYISTISSRDSQSGESGHVPYETFGFRSGIDSNDLGIVVKHHSGGVPQWIQLMVWGSTSVVPFTGKGSIGNPSESANPGMLAVGAAHWNDVRAIEPYSSRGPTPDGRVKPDIVGADCGETALSPLGEYNWGFCGTSQAAPHVAGMAALVRQRFPDYTPAQVAAYLKDAAEQREGPDPNPTWGHGFAILPPPSEATQPTPPTLSPAFTRNPAADFTTLQAAGNTQARGIWSDGTTMWVADLAGQLYAYDLGTKDHVPAEDFATLNAAGNTRPQGIWSDGATMWVADYAEEKIYAYDRATKARVPAKDFDTLRDAGNTHPRGIWSDGTTMWVADSLDDKIYAYDMATKARIPAKDFDTLKAARSPLPLGIWSDGTTMWVADAYTYKLYAYDLDTRARVFGDDFNTLITAANFAVRGIWSDGTTMWVADAYDDKIYAYRMPGPDLVVDTPTVDNNSPAAGASFTLSAAVRNLTSGASAPTTLRYYLSTDSTISGDDTEVGTDPVSGLAGSGSSLQSLSLTAPPAAGTYYYGACVDSIAGESDTGNNCSPAVAVTVTEPPGAPTGLAATANGEARIDLSWSAPASDGGSAITGYRIEVSTDGSSFSDLVADTNSAATVYAHTGLSLGDTRHYRVSAINSVGAGPPSNVAAATTVPAPSGSVSAARSLSPASVAPSGQVVVTIAATDYGAAGRVTETLPAGFSYVSSSLDAVQVDVSGQDVRFVLLGSTSFTYTVTASSAVDSYTFSGTLRDYDRNDHVIGGAATVTVASGDPLVARYDANGNGEIDRSELIAAINDYLSGDGEPITKADLMRLIDLYSLG